MNGNGLRVRIKLILLHFLVGEDEEVLGMNLKLYFEIITARFPQREQYM